VTPSDEVRSGPVATGITLVITQVTSASALAAACAMAKTAVTAFDTPDGAVAIVDQASDPAGTAATISGLLRDIPILVMHSADGQITAHMWERGEQSAEVSPALALAGAAEVVEQLLTGQLAVSDLDPVISSAQMSRWKAMRILASARRAGRR
jgi:hypothetical protein